MSDRDHRDDDPRPDDSQARPGNNVVETTESAERSEAESRETWVGEPNSTLSVETSQVSSKNAPPGAVPLVIVDRQRSQPERTKRDDDRDDRSKPAQNQGRREQADRDESRSQAPGMMSLIAVAAAALIFGMAGAWGYMTFFGPSKPQNDDDSSQTNGSSQASNSGSGSGSQSSSGSSSSKGSGNPSGMASEIPGFTSADDADTLKKQIADLASRLDRLSGRVDELSRPDSATPPGLHTLQNKVGELSRTVDDLASIPEDFRRQQATTQELKEQFALLRAQMTGKTGQ